MGRAWIALAALAAALLIGGAGIATAADGGGGEAARGGNGFVRHAGPNWVWFGPRSWDAAYSAYGLTIFGNGGSTIDYGGSSTINDGNPAQHFKAARQRFKNLPGLSRVKFRKVSRIKTNRPFNQGGTASQTMKFSARANGKKIGGELGYQYAIYVPDPLYAYQAQLYKATIDDRDFKAAMRTVNAVWSGAAYSGPGLPINPFTGLP